MVAPRPADLTPDELEAQVERTKRRRRFVRQACGQCWGSAVLLQVYLFALAAFIRLCDPEEAMVILFKFEANDDGRKHTFREAVDLYKATYYLAAVFLTFFLVGLVAIVISCGVSCGRCQQCRPIHPDVGTAACCNSCGRSCVYCPINGGDCACCNGFCVDATNACPALAGDCPCCAGCSGIGGDCAPALLAFLVAVVVIFIIVGILIVFVGMVVWSQKMFERYLQMRELRELTGEYIVQDLSREPEFSHFVSGVAPAQTNMNPPDGGAVQAAAAMHPNVPEHPEGDLHQRMMRDLQAVYGLDEEALREQLQGEQHNTAAAEANAQGHGHQERQAQREGAHGANAV